MGLARDLRRPDEPSGAAQNELDAVGRHEAGGGVYIWSNTSTPISLDHPLKLLVRAQLRPTAGRTIIFAGTGPKTPRFHCGSRSRFLNVTFEAESGIAGATVEVAWLSAEHGRAEQGGLIWASAARPWSGTGRASGGTRLRLLDLSLAHGKTSRLAEGECKTIRPQRRCFEGGGAISVDQVSALEVVRVNTTDCATHASGGALSTVEVDDVHVQNSTLTRSRAEQFGGAISLWASSRTFEGTWVLSGVAVHDAQSGYNGGGISLWASGDVGAGARWSVLDSEVTDARSGWRGGGISFLTGENVTGNVTWSVENTRVDGTHAGYYGGGISFVSVNDAGGGAKWLVSRVAVSNATAGWLGGGVSLEAINSMQQGSEWIVEDSTFAHTHAKFHGGGVFFEANDQLAGNVSWSITNTTVAHASAGANGGGVSMQVPHIADARISADGLDCSDTHASTGGGCVAFWGQTAVRTEFRTARLRVLRSSAFQGGAIGMVIPDVLHNGGVYGSELPHFVLRMFDTSAHSTHARGHGGVLHVEAHEPSVHRWRKQDNTCNEFATLCDEQCKSHTYNSSAVPYAFGARLLIDGASVYNATSDGRGAVAFLANVAARLRNVVVSHANSTRTGGVLALSRVANLSLTNVTGCGVRAGQGSFLSHEDGNLNLTMDGVRLVPHCSSNSFPSADAWHAGATRDGARDLSWIRAESVTSATARDVTLACPLGAVVPHQGPRTSLSYVFPSLPIIVEFLDRAGRCSTRRVNDTVPHTFKFFAEDVRCEQCPPAKYTLVRQAWTTAQRGSGRTLSANVSAGAYTCHPCPYGADCSWGGAKVVPLPGRWGTLKRGGDGLGHEQLISSFPVLSYGYACPNNASGCLVRYDSCVSGRVGIGCGQCRRGHGESITSASCIPAQSCLHSPLSRATWVVLPLGVLGVVLFYVASSGDGDAGTSPAGKRTVAASQGERTGLANIMFTLFQLEAAARADNPNVATILSHMSQLKFIAPGSGEDVCLWPEMGTVTKALLGAGLSALLPFVLLLVYAVHLRLALSRSPLASRLVSVRAMPTRGLYVRAFVGLMHAAYGTLVDTAVRLVAPIHIDTYGKRQALTGMPLVSTWHFWLGVVWLGTSATWAPLFAFWGLAHLRAGTMTVVEYAWGIVFPLPLLVWRVVQPYVRGRAWRPPETRRRARVSFARLTRPYRKGAWYWDAVLMARRALFATLYLVIPNSYLHRAFGYLVLSALYLATHAHMRPFASAALNKVASVGLSGLIFVSGASLVTAYQRTNGSPIDVDTGNLHAAASWLLYLVPVLCAFLVVVRWQQRRSLRSRHGADDKAQHSDTGWEKLRPASEAQDVSAGPQPMELQDLDTLDSPLLQHSER